MDASAIGRFHSTVAVLPGESMDVPAGGLAQFLQQNLRTSGYPEVHPLGGLWAWAYHGIWEVPLPRAKWQDMVPPKGPPQAGGNFRPVLVNGPWYGHSLADYLGTGPVRKLSARAIGGLLENGLGCGYPLADYLGTGPVRKLSAMATGGCDIRVSDHFDISDIGPGCSKMGSGAGIRRPIALVLGLLESSRLWLGGC
ncbi:hypothetical protein B0H16DRAFT_1707883, partial [Mycena metata]